MPVPPTPTGLGLTLTPAELVERAQREIAAEAARRAAIANAARLNPPGPPIQLPAPGTPFAVELEHRRELAANRLHEQLQNEKNLRLITLANLREQFARDTREARAVMRRDNPDAPIQWVADVLLEARDAVINTASNKAEKADEIAEKLAVTQAASRAGIIQKLPLASGFVAGTALGPFFSPEDAGAGEEARIAQQQAFEAAVQQQVNVIKARLLTQQPGVPVDQAAVQALAIRQVMEMLPMWACDP